MKTFTKQWEYLKVKFCFRFVASILYYHIFCIVLADLCQSNTHFRRLGRKETGNSKHNK